MLATSIKTNVRIRAIFSMLGASIKALIGGCLTRRVAVLYCENRFRVMYSMWSPLDGYRRCLPTTVFLQVHGVRVPKAIIHYSSGQIGIKQAVREYSIPRNTLRNKLRGNHKNNVGRPLVFTPEEEDIFKKHALVLSDMGLPISLYDLRSYPDFKAVFGQNISRKRAQIDKDMINKIFDNLERVLVNVPPQNIFNYDETGFHDCPKKGKYLFRHQNRHPEIIRNSTKLAHGWTKRFQVECVKVWCFDMEIYEDWFCEHLLPRLRKYPGKKVIIGDNLAAHMSQSPKTV
ncbi:hypothetical protein PR048_033081 [Dryococelus australis]|uniref:HTH psq-type domain-containing protein n=1 Tax=Dryococelus australis TaxID=614101 RepID=A0ABQ9G3G2_9NEOP|nr:hypothetical protein PR048_033081 [Dryococelus australis]